MLFGQPRAYHRWDGNRFLLADLPPKQQGLIAPSVVPPEIKAASPGFAAFPQTGGSSGLDGAPSRGSPGTEQSASRGRGDRSDSYASLGGTLGTLGGLALGVTGLGAVGTIAGTAVDHEQAKASLGRMGVPSDDLSFGKALANNALMGIPGKLGAGWSFGDQISGLAANEVGRLSSLGDMSVAGQEAGIAGDPAAAAAAANNAASLGDMSISGFDVSHGGIGGGPSSSGGVDSGEAGGGVGGDAGVGNDGGMYRLGGYTGNDGDSKIEARKVTVHEKEFVQRPEAVALYGQDFMAALNNGLIDPLLVRGLLGQPRQRPMFG